MDPVTGLSNLGTDIKTVIIVFIGALIAWQILKVLWKNPGFAGVCGAVALCAFVYYASQGGGIADIASAIQAAVRKYVLFQEK